MIAIKLLKKRQIYIRILSLNKSNNLSFIFTQTNLKDKSLFN